MKKITRIFIMLICFLTLIGCSATIKRGNDIEKYDEYILKVEHSRSFMPFLEDLEDYEAINCYYKCTDGAIYIYYTINLIVEYSKDNYNQKKQEILDKYNFLNAPISHPVNKGEYYIPNPNFMYKNYNIMVVQDQDFRYPKWFGMVGYNDEDYNLSYLFFWGIDIGQIINSINFMDKFFDFQYE